MRRAAHRLSVMTATLGALLAAGQVEPACAQGRSFVYSLLPEWGVTRSRGLVYSDVAFARDAFAALGPEELEQRFGVDLAAGGRARLVAQVGWAATDASVRNRVSGQAELLVSLAQGPRAMLAVGLGGARSYDGVGVALGRVAGGLRWQRTLLAGNLRLERPLGSDSATRDALDVISTLGVTRQLRSGLRVGLEAVGEDLEGFVDADEAEGGAKAMFGPTLRLGAPEARWGLAVTGGPVLQLTRSAVARRTSGAARDLTTNRGYVLRTSITCRW
jgi:hypothetical protein